MQIGPKNRIVSYSALFSDATRIVSQPSSSLMDVAAFDNGCNNPLNIFH